MLVRRADYMRMILTQVIQAVHIGYDVLGRYPL